MITYAGISVLNAISSGIGSVIPINLIYKTNLCNNHSNVNYMDKKILEYAFNVKIMDIKIIKKTNIPQGYGLKSSSAYTTSIIGGYANFSGTKLSKIEIANISSIVSKRMGISITGAFDDALASVTSRFVITDNFKNRVLKMEKFAKMKVIISLPNIKRPDNIKEKLRKYDFSEAVNYVLKGHIQKGAIENGYLVARALDYPQEPLDTLINLGSSMVGYSGNGPALFATVNSDNIERIRKYMKKFGKIIETQMR